MDALLNEDLSRGGEAVAAVPTARERSAPRPRAPWRRRSGAEVLIDQLGALDAWLAVLRSRDELARRLPDRPGQVSREARLDHARRADVLACERAALLARAAGQDTDLLPPARHTALRAVVVLRRRWVRDALTAQLALHHVDVIASLESGGDAIAAVVLEHPDLLIVEDLLPLVSGMDIARHARQLAPAIVIGVQVHSPSVAAAATAGGADAAFSRATAPSQIAQHLTGHLTGA